MPSLIYQASLETIETVGHKGPDRKPGPAEGSRMELNFEAFHFTIIKTLGSPGTSFTPGVKAEQEKKCSRETQRTWGRQAGLNLCYKLEHK